MWAFVLVAVVCWGAEPYVGRDLCRAAADRQLRSAYSSRVVYGDLPVPGATVTASNGERQVSTVTDEHGSFTLSALENGRWAIRVEMSAFTVLTREVEIGGATPPGVWALTLEPFESLAGESPPPARSDREPATGGLTGGGGADPQAGATVRPAVSAPEEGPAPEVADGFLINGSVNNAAASPVAQSPAFGNNRRSGPSLYSGLLSVVYGSSRLDARPFTFAGARTTRPDYQNVRVTATFGGPIKISRMRRDPNVFVSFQHDSDHNTTTQPGVVPTLSERRGDLSSSQTSTGEPVQVLDPETGVPFPGNAIPTDRLSPQAQALLNYFPLPTIDGDTGFNFQAPILSRTADTRVTTRVTQALDANTQLTGLVAYQRLITDQQTMFGFKDQRRVSGVDVSLTLMRRFSQTTTLRLRYQFTGVTNRTTPFFAHRSNVSGEAGVTGNDRSPENWGPPALQFSSLTDLSDALPAWTRNRTSGGGAELFASRGNHNVAVGGDLRHVATGIRAQLNPRGAFTFTGVVTGSDLADFLLGLPATSAIAFGNADKDLGALASNAYISDDWRLRPTLTMQIGARWEYEQPPAERLGRLVNLDTAPGFAESAPVLAGETGSITGRSYPAPLIRSDWTGVQPRVGLAWRPIPVSSLIVRAGYGIYRNNGIYQSIAVLLSQQPPLSTTFTVSRSATESLSLAGFTVPSMSAGNTFAVDPDLRAGISQNWQILVQRDLFGALTFSASYLGTRGTRLLQEFLPNTYPAGALNPCPTCPAGFIYLTSGGTSTRHAGQWQLRWRLRRGFAASVHYTLSKAKDNAGAFTNASTSGSAIAQNWLDLEAEEARSNFDQRHLIVAQAQYTTGIGLGGGGLADGMRGRLLGGWTVITQLNAGSGLPLTPVYLAPVPGTGVTGPIRPSLTGAPLDPIDGRYLNPDAYTAPAPGEWGTAGRNSVTGPGTFNFDLSVTRTFTLSNRISLDWRIDAMNVVNRRTFTGVNLMFGGPAFGSPNLANSPRRIVSTTRLRF